MEKEQGNYTPLFVLIGISALAGAAISLGTPLGLAAWMHYFMGVFLCIFAMLKLFDLKGFEKGFLMYDLVAKKDARYARAYPFIELALGLGYLSFFATYLVYVLTILVFGIGAYGVMKALKAGLNTKCVCMGNVLNVPLSTVTLTEDVLMIVMALYMLLA